MEQIESTRSKCTVIFAELTENLIMTSKNLGVVVLHLRGLQAAAQSFAVTPHVGVVFSELVLGELHMCRSTYQKKI
jgi:hypothetical protein